MNQGPNSLLLEMLVWRIQEFRLPSGLYYAGYRDVILATVEGSGMMQIDEGGFSTLATEMCEYHHDRDCARNNTSHEANTKVSFIRRCVEHNQAVEMSVWATRRVRVRVKRRSGAM